MAGTKLRLYNPEWTNLTTPAILKKKDVHGNYPMIFEIYAQETAAANAELGGAANAVLDGTTTPVIVITVSSQANDDYDIAAADAQAIALIGISVADPKQYIKGLERPVYSVEEIHLNGVADVNSTRYYLRLIHAYCIKWGTTASDPVGNVTIEYPANTTMLTITAGNNESNGCKIYGTPYHEGRWNLLDLTMYDLAYNNT